jgi:Alpha-kinase family
MGANQSTETYFSVDQDEDHYRYQAKFDTNLLGEGTFRFAYHGEISSSTPSGGPKVGTQCVVKVFKSDYRKNYDQWVPDLVAHERAFKMAETFNRVPLDVTPRRKITVMKPLVAKVRCIIIHAIIW